MNPTDDAVKEVYAQFGLAYYRAEVLHRGLANFYVFSLIHASLPITRLRVEEHFASISSATFGRVVNLVQPYIPTASLPSFQKAIEKRNFLAHHFWYDRIHLLTTAEGCSQACQELENYGATFQALDADIESLIGPLISAIGASPEQIEAASSSVLRGEDGSLYSQRTPRKEEVIVAVYQSRASETAAALFFESDDHLFWQLCDAGLGWAPFDAALPTWLPAKEFSAVLPAHINPRPQLSGPWSYELFFGKGFNLVVRPGQEPGSVTWTVRRRGA